MLMAEQGGENTLDHKLMSSLLILHILHIKFEVAHVLNIKSSKKSNVPALKHRAES